MRPPPETSLTLGPNPELTTNSLTVTPPSATTRRVSAPSATLPAATTAGPAATYSATSTLRSSSRSTRRPSTTRGARPRGRATTAMTVSRRGRRRTGGAGPRAPRRRPRMRRKSRGLCPWASGPALASCSSLRWPRAPARRRACRVTGTGARSKSFLASDSEVRVAGGDGHGGCVVRWSF